MTSNLGTRRQRIVSKKLNEIENDLPVKTKGLSKKNQNHQGNCKEAHDKRKQDHSQTVTDSNVELTEKIAAECLCLLGNIYTGDGYAYLKLDAHDYHLSKIDIICCYQYLQFINLNNNLLQNPQLKVLRKLPCIILLELNNNQLQSTEIPKLPFLQSLTMKDNRIRDVKPFDHECLEFLDLENNQITKIPEETFVKCPTLVKLSMKMNMLTSTCGIHCESLAFLYLQNNAIFSIEGIEHLVNLEVLNVRGNLIKRLGKNSFPPSLAKLSYVNLRENKMHRIKDFRRLKHLPKLATLVCFQNAFDKHGEGQEVRGPILVHLPHLRRLNKTRVTVKEREKFRYLEDSSSTDSSELIEADDDVTTFSRQGEQEDENVDARSMLYGSDVSWKLSDDFTLGN